MNPWPWGLGMGLVALAFLYEIVKRLTNLLNEVNRLRGELGLMMSVRGDGSGPGRLGQMNEELQGISATVEGIRDFQMHGAPRPSEPP